MISSSVTSMIRPGQFSDCGRCSRSMVGIGSLTSAETGTLTESLTDMPLAAQVSQSLRAVMMTRSVSARISCSLAPGRKTPGLITPRVGWRARTSPSAPTSRMVLRSIFG